jgi:hypothetical protein
MTYFMEAVGWVGAGLVLLAYALVSSGKAAASSKLYQTLNIAGALGLVVNSSWNGAIPSAVVNVIWIGIGLYGVVRARRVGGA